MKFLYLLLMLMQNNSFTNSPEIQHTNSNAFNEENPTPSDQDKITVDNLYQQSTPESLHEYEPSPSDSYNCKKAKKSLLQSLKILNASLLDIYNPNKALYYHKLGSIFYSLHDDEKDKK